MKRTFQLPAALAWGQAARVLLFACAAGMCAASKSAGETAGDPAASLDRFRRSIWAEPVYLEFDLRQMPRRGDEHVFHGRLWGGRNDTGSVTRFEIDVGKGGFTRRILAQSGSDPALWLSEAGGAPVREDDAAEKPLVAGLEMTPFDIEMPYLYWLDVEMGGEQRIRGRSAFTYVFTPPAEFAARNPAIRSVRAYLDAQYGALVQSEVTGPSGNLSKTLSLLELRKVGDRWIPKDVDVRNEATRDKTRLSVTGVSVGIAVDPATFDPARLGAPVAPPPEGRIIRVAE